MRLVVRWGLLALAAAAALFYGWHVRLAFREAEPPPPIAESVTQPAWAWGQALMRERGYAPAGAPSSRAIRLGPVTRDTSWLYGGFPWVEAHWRGASEELELEPLQLAPGQCVGLLVRGTGQLRPPRVELWEGARRYVASSHSSGMVSVLQMCLPPGTEPRTFGAQLTASAASAGDFVVEGTVQWARFQRTMAPGEALELIGEFRPALNDLFEEYAERQPGLEAERRGMVAVRRARVPREAVLLVPHTLATYQKLVARFEAAYPEKVPNPALVAPSEGTAPASNAETEAIAAHVREHASFSDGSTVTPHPSLIDGRVLVALDLDALGGCVRVVLAREAEEAFPSLELRVDDAEPVDLQAYRQRVVSHDLCPGTGFARFVTHEMEQVPYTIAVYRRPSDEAKGAPPASP